MNRFGLTIAVPARRAARRDARRCSTRIGVDTAEVRANDRKLLFDDVGHRHDAPVRRADLRRGRRRRHRDHRQGRAHGAVRARRSSSCSTSATARCRMVLATVDGEPDPAAEALRRLGVMRVATKYPRIAARYFERTGRQAEIVEVKGSVELAPLTGLVEAIVDLTATGHDAARERPRRPRGDRRRRRRG